MANTYTQIHLHFIFAVKYREGIILPSFKAEIEKYMSIIIQKNNHKVLIINSMPDHVHILIGMRPNQSISTLVQEVKSSSSKWLNDKKYLKGHFEWQEGYGAFSYGKSQIKNVMKYVETQQEHHRTKNFKEEYKAFLEIFEIEYEEKYSFENPREYL